VIPLPLTGRSRYVFALAMAGLGVLALGLFHDFFQRSPLTPAWIVSLISLLVAGVAPAIVAEVIIILATIYLAIEPIDTFGLVIPGDTIRVAIWIACIGLADFLAWRLQVARTVSAAREKALSQSESRYRDLLQQASDGIVLLEPDGRFALVNQRAAEMLGYREDELLARRLPEVYVSGERLRPGPDWERVPAGVVLEERKLRRKDGTVFDAELSLRRTSEGRLQGILRDITERRRVEEARLAAQRTLERVIASVPGVVYEYVMVRGRPGRFAYVSERIEELTGVTAGELLQDPEALLRVVDPEDREAAGPVFRRASERLEPYAVNFRIRSRPGTVRWLRAIATPVQEGPALIWHGVIVDITEQRRLEEELLQAQKMESLGRLAGGVAHDFNNLLTLIRGYADVLASQLGGEDPRLEEVREIRHAADRGASLTRQLLALSRRQKLVAREVDLNELVRDLERMLRRVIGASIEIVTVTGPELGWVRADPGQLEQVLLNLAVNARDAMPRGGTLRLETARVQVPPGALDRSVRGVPAGDYVQLTVSDTGTGMDADVLAKAFEPFFTTKPPGEGTGLGLSTVYGIVQQSGGAITVESSPGQGTVFRLFFPRVSAETPRAEEPSPAAREPLPSRGTVLVVEDEERVRRLTCRILEHYGYGVVEAADGPQALDLLRQNSPRVDALISDVVMPGMSGPDLAARARTERPDLPVLLLSGFTADELPGDVPQGSRQAFLQKPFSPEALATAVGDLLALSR
jgi:two-component system cell cycle sensor histidine kinase/response regulator CckA